MPPPPAKFLPGERHLSWLLLQSPPTVRHYERSTFISSIDRRKNELVSLLSRVNAASTRPASWA